MHRLASADYYDALKSAGLPQQNFAALRMTYSRGGRWASVFVGKVTLPLKLSLRLAGSPPPSTEGGEGCAVDLNVGRLSCSRRFAGKGYFTYGKSQRLLRRSPRDARVLHRLASADCYDAFKSAGLPQQNFTALRMTHSRGVRAVGVC